MKVLCMCQGGNSRSVGMAYLLKYFFNLDALSCSWEKNSQETINMLCKWADKIIVMEEKFKIYIPIGFKYKVLICDVGEDIWFKISDDLLRKCMSVLEPYFKELNLSYLNIKGN